MKKIGLIGGLSWESTAYYYQFINQMIRDKRGGFNSACCMIDSLNFEEIIQLQKNEDWSPIAEILIESARRLESAGADCVLLCCNTLHVCSYSIQSNISIPFIHIIDSLGNAIKKESMSKVALLGTRYAMEHGFIQERLLKYGITIHLPSLNDRSVVHDIIYNELIQGKASKLSKRCYTDIISKLSESGAEGVVLGCTDIRLLISQVDTAVRLFDTTQIHAEAAVDYSLG